VSALLVIYNGFAFQEGEAEQAIPAASGSPLAPSFEHASGTLELPLSRLILDQNSAGNWFFTMPEPAGGLNLQTRGF